MLCHVKVRTEGVTVLQYIQAVIAFALPNCNCATKHLLKLECKNMSNDHRNIY